MSLRDDQGTKRRSGGGSPSAALGGAGRGTRRIRDREDSPTARVRPCITFVLATRLSRPSLSLRDVPPRPSRYALLRGGPRERPSRAPARHRPHWCCVSRRAQNARGRVWAKPILARRSAGAACARIGAEADSVPMAVNRYRA
jgi:hypothetical protein